MKMCCPSLAASGSSVSRLISPISSPDTVDSVTGSSAKTQQCHQEVHLWNKFTLKRARNMQDKTAIPSLHSKAWTICKVVFSPTSEIPIKRLKALWQNHCIDTFASKQNQLTGSPPINPLINSHTCLQGYPFYWEPEQPWNTLPDLVEVTSQDPDPRAIQIIGFASTRVLTSASTFKIRA